jgi:hypothetical protein
MVSVIGIVISSEARDLYFRRGCGREGFLVALLLVTTSGCGDENRIVVGRVKQSLLVDGTGFALSLFLLNRTP